MSFRSYIVLQAGVFNCLLIMHLCTTPIVSDERPWYPRAPDGPREALDPAMGTLLPSTTPLNCAPTGAWWAFEVWRPSPAEIAQLERDLAQFLPIVDSVAEYRYWDRHPPFGAYQRQYLGVHHLGDPPIIYVNAFLADDDSSPQDRRSRMVCVDDGGTGYWHVQYDPVGRRFRRFGFNGTA